MAGRSTEWVEEFIPWISATNVAYINIDVGATGTSFAAAAAPLLDNVIYAATAAVRSPNQTVPGQTVRDVWDGRIATMGSGSDFTAFQDFAGVPCINIGFQPGPGGAVYHYHSNYDSFHWMAEFGDPGFLYHHTAAQLMGLMTAQVADLPVLSFRAFDYAKALSRYVKQVEAKLKAKVTTGFPSVAEGVEPALLPTDAEYFALRAQQTRRPDSAPSVPSGATAASFEKSLARLHAALGKLTPKAAALDARADSLEGEAEQTLPWWKWPSKLWLAYQIRTVNTKYKFLERNFLYAEGLDGRPWFKHVVFAPGLWTGYAGGA